MSTTEHPVVARSERDDDDHPCPPTHKFHRGTDRYLCGRRREPGLSRGLNAPCVARGCELPMCGACETVYLNLALT